MITDDVGKRIKTLRTAMGLSQEKLALKAGVDRTYLAGIESGKRNVTIISLEKITVSELSNIITQDKLSYKIVAPNTFIKDVKKLFSPQNNASRELEVVYITDNGKANGNLLGMVTAADVASW